MGVRARGSAGAWAVVGRRPDRPRIVSCSDDGRAVTLRFSDGSESKAPLPRGKDAAFRAAFLEAFALKAVGKDAFGRALRDMERLTRPRSDPEGGPDVFAGAETAGKRRSRVSRAIEGLVY